MVGPVVVTILPDTLEITRSTLAKTAIRLRAMNIAAMACRVIRAEIGSGASRRLETSDWN